MPDASIWPTGTNTITYSTGGPNPPANLTATSLTLASTATYVVNITGTSTGTDANLNDIGTSTVLTLTGTASSSLSLGGATLQVNDVGATITAGQVFKFIKYDGSANVWDGTTFGTITSLGGNQYTVNYAAGDPFVELQAVPEPGTWAMLLGGFGVLAFWQRSRRCVSLR